MSICLKCGADAPDRNIASPAEKLDRAIDLSLIELEVRELLNLVRCTEPDFVVWNKIMMRKLEDIHALTLQTLGK